MKLIYTHKHIHACVYIFNSKKYDATRLAKVVQFVVLIMVVVKLQT
jgi:hypothetical protein